jgi:hypothetical protein
MKKGRHMLNIIQQMKKKWYIGEQVVDSDPEFPQARALQYRGERERA